MDTTDERRNADAEDREARAADRAGRSDDEVELIAGIGDPRTARGQGIPTRRLPRQPRLKQTIELIPTDDGRLHLFRGGEADCSVDGSNPLVRCLLEALSGEATSGDVIARVAGANSAAQAEVREAIAELYALGLVEDAAADHELSARERERYDRQLRYFGDLAPPTASRAAYQRRLSAAHVVVLGAGGLGGWSAYGLAGAGIGRIDIVDGDVVELSNLNRQVLFTERDIGRPKAAAAAAALQALNSDIEINGQALMISGQGDVEALISGADLVIDAVDFPPHEIERWVNAACFAAGVPYIAMSQFPPLVRLGPMYVPGCTGCYRCQGRDWAERFAHFEAVRAARQGKACPAAALGPACGLIGSQVAVDAVHLLSGVASPATFGRAIVLDLRTLAVERWPVPRDAGCDVCGGQRDPDASNPRESAGGPLT